MRRVAQVWYGDENQTYFASNYARCSLRDWLNADFFQTAFSTAQQANILTTHLVNKSTSNYYDVPDSDDKIFLLSFDEAQKSAYGFSFTYTRCCADFSSRDSEFRASEIKHEKASFRTASSPRKDAVFFLFVRA